jgi:hypothetical protein
MKELGFEYSIGAPPAKDWLFLSSALSPARHFLAFGNRRRKGSLISYLFEPFIIVVQPGRQLSTLVLLSKELYHGQAISSILRK